MASSSRSRRYRRTGGSSRCSSIRNSSRSRSRRIRCLPASSRPATGTRWESSRQLAAGSWQLAVAGSNALAATRLRVPAARCPLPAANYNCSVKPVRVGSLFIGGGHPLAFILGPCVIESASHALETAAAIRESASRCGVPVIFKASYDKANRTSLSSFRGPGLDAGLRILADMRALPMLRELGYPVVFDVTHSLQLPGAGDGVTAGLAQYIEPLASAGVAAGVDAVFMEVHAEPSKARSDAANALRLDRLEPLIMKLKRIDIAARETVIASGART